MTPISAISTATYGIQQNMRHFNETASHFAGQPLTADFPADIESMVDVKIAQRTIEANANVIKAADEMLGTLLDLFA